MFKFNRNHRKIIVIDGQIGYIGGFNVGDDYLGLGKLGYYIKSTNIPDLTINNNNLTMVTIIHSKVNNW
jgi:phosphatidylserine/phosphatidylglycerophosphate/cardiolipin synthase-like enzyme